MAATTLSSNHPNHDTFRLAVLACGTGLVGLVVWTSLRLGGDTATVALEDLGEVVAAMFGAMACAWAARRTSNRLSTAWWLMSASAASWGVGEAVWSIYEVGLGVAVPFPSAADVGFLVAVPLAVAAVLAFPSAPASATNRWRAVLDGAIVANSLLFVGWALGLGDVYERAALAPGARLIAIAYPAADVLVITLLALGIRRATGSLRIPVMVLTVSFAWIMGADSAFAYLTLSGAYGVFGSQSDTGWVVGYLLIGLAALWPTARTYGVAEDGPVEPWQLAMPWIAVLSVMATGGWMAATGNPPDSTTTALGTGLGILFIMSQALTLRDSVRLVYLSRRAEATLKERTALLNQVITCAPLGIARFGLNLRLVDANPRLCAILGTPASILIGSLVTEYLSSEELDQLAGKFDALRSGGEETIEGVSEVHRPDGSSTWLHWVVTAVRPTGGEIDYFLAMYEDVKAKHEADEAAMANLAGLERLNRLKSEFMSMVSHEFRTALTGIQGYSELMSAQEVTPDEVKEFSGDINSDALRLNRMITEMLDLDRIESGRISLHLAPVDLNQLLQDAIGRAQVTTNKHVIVAGLEPSLPHVDGDCDRLTEVVSNLLSNAIKYSPKGGEIEVTTQSKNGEVQVTVKDHGQGIPPEFTNRIFGRYERFEGNGPAQVVGTGLGLAIAQQIVQLHKGRMWVDSTFGEGSEFHFTIPARLENAPVGAEAADAA